MYRINVHCSDCRDTLCEFIEKRGDGVFKKNYLTLSEIREAADVMAFLKKNGYYICTRCGKKSWE